ncbi:3-deoxy-manno-octulosonate cytidylyltransferase [Campylobacter coli]|uniref:3-deoxy-manno-octulosonate cytidylyltransferase n=1 Tax=Campylobacter coli TaxID=195 RepID=UPI0007077169|nr:3-deoxy-manno-octulosonate cytidylyltransferase [Campylobacter coli]EAH4913675.1 3-deoxy-manno-octulosonate cytidylyltransferase [Campylobacter coli]EAH6010892.1 3-deoxy-manno-octulosonate cytidylyltransferase [Campylobacter coli]EAH6024247.1 3-deoxy-manno-octulosonate cytidylyltransferase [Campylobacter coli]EAI0403181.1 3-deoxy-manno-octulosonate cytidylyltransferase [Campylobacter coli]EAI1065710.1 3-deoxy-manno-octulosonate cytidylyltransferase [Campylobacter coli]
MKILGVIPARYGSTRFPGKPLADILGKPMIWWVYQQAKKAKKLTDLVVATDDKKITDVCDQYKIPWIMTNIHYSGISRIHEVAERIDANLYIQINGDEPLIKHEMVDQIVPRIIVKDFIANLICKIKTPNELLDPSNIKVVFNKNKEILYMSRAPIPNPYKCLKFDYYKHVGILAYTKSMLDFFVKTKASKYEEIEGLETLRFIEHDKKILCIETNHFRSLSVDTPKDLESVITILASRRDI